LFYADALRAAWVTEITDEVVKQLNFEGFVSIRPHLKSGVLKFLEEEYNSPQGVRMSERKPTIFDYLKEKIKAADKPTRRLSYAEVRERMDKRKKEFANE
jgi:hypothetical protein